MKLHLREMEIGRHSYRVISLRPGTKATFSTNHFHDTWHIVTDLAGARLLARLFWGLSYQEQRGTVIVLHGEHLRPTPFDAAPSDPILLLPAHLTAMDRDALHRLKDRLNHLPAPTRTVRWRTYGLDRSLADRERFREENGLQYTYSPWGPVEDWKWERMDRCGGFVCYTAPPRVLREQAVALHRMRYWETLGEKTDYHFLSERQRGSYGDGEVQIFEHYHRMLSEADVARREVLAESTRLPPPEPLREAIYRQCEIVHTRRHQRRPNTPLPLA